MGNKEIGTKIKLEGEKEFNRQMTAINSGLKTTRSDMALLSAEFEDNANSVEALTAKQKLLQSSVDQHKAKVDALRAQYKKASATLGETEGRTQKYKQQLNKATIDLIKAEKALDQTNDALESQRSAMSEAADAVEVLGDASKKAEPKIEAVGEAVEDVEKKADKSNGAFASIARGIGSVTSASIKAGAAVVALGAGLGVTGLTAMVSFAREAAEAAKAAKEAGETLTESQSAWLGYADNLEMLDVSASKAKTALAGVLLPTLNKVSTSGAAYLNNFVRSIEAAGNDTQRQSAVISEYISYGAEMILQNLPQYAQVGGDLLGGIKDGFLEAFPELSEAGVTMIFDFLQSIIDGAPEAGRAGEILFNELVSGLESRGPDIAYSAAEILSSLTLWLIENAPALIPVAGEILLSFATGLIEATPDLADAAGDMIVSLGEYLTDPDNLAKLAQKALKIGGKIAQSIWDGLVALWNDLAAGFPGLVDGLNAGANYAIYGSTSLGIPGHASGLDYVPYDNYLARLHRGEMVLTSAEADAYRRLDGATAPAKIVNLTINAKTITEAEINMILDLVNRKLGDDL